MRHPGFRALGGWLSLLLLIGALAPVAAAAPAPPPARDTLVNINTASVDELVSLPGIGKAYAQRIVDYRTKNGPFKRIEDLLNVQGIGDKTFEKIRSRLTVGKS